MVDVAAALVLLLGALVQAATGFGFALAAAPPLFVLLEPAAAVSALAVIGTQVNLMTLASERRRPVVMRAQAAGLVAAAVPGLWLGTIVLRWLPEDVLRVAVGLLVLGALALRAFGPRADVARSPARPWETAASGLASGMLNTSTGLSGPPLVLHLLGRCASPGAMRDTLAAIFFATGVLGLAALVASGVFAAPGALPALVLAAAAGQVAGRRLFALLAPAAYERIVIAVLVVAALAALASAAL